MLTFGTKIILLLLLIGGTIAIVGNYIGRAIGRRRLTLFNLRPRHTAYAITVLTGILIVFTTLGVILIISNDARTALFGLEELRKDVAQKSDELAQRITEREKINQELEAIRTDLTASKTDLAKARANLAWAKREISALEKTKEKLGREVEVSRQGKVLFKVGEVLLTSLIQAGPEKNKLEAGLKQILSAADAYVRSFGIEKALPALPAGRQAARQEKHLIFVSPEEFDRAVAILKERRGENIIAVTAIRNTVFGEEVPVRFAISANRLIYRSGEEIADSAIMSSLSVPEIEQEIKKLLSITHLTAKKAGVLPDASGSVGSVPYSRIFALAKRIKAYRKGVKLKSLAKGDTYTIGPLEVAFKIFYQ